MREPSPALGALGEVLIILGIPLLIVIILVQVFHL